MQQCCNDQIHHGSDLQCTVVNIEIRWDDGTGALTSVCMYTHYSSRTRCRNGSAVLTTARPVPSGRLTSQRISKSTTEVH